MHVIINHNANTPCEIIGANMTAVRIVAKQIMQKFDDGGYKNIPDLFIDIFGHQGLNDAEKCVLFHIINKILDKTMCIIVTPPEVV